MLKGFIPLWPEQFTVLDKYIQLIIALFANAVILVQYCSFTCFYVIIIFLISYFSNTAILEYGSCFINLPTGGSTSRNVPHNTFFLPLWVKTFLESVAMPPSRNGTSEKWDNYRYPGHANLAWECSSYMKIWPQCSSCLWEYGLNVHHVCENMATMFT